MGFAAVLEVCLEAALAALPEGHIAGESEGEAAAALGAWLEAHTRDDSEAWPAAEQVEQIGAGFAVPLACLEAVSVA